MIGARILIGHWHILQTVQFLSKYVFISFFCEVSCGNDTSPVSNVNLNNAP